MDNLELLTILQLSDSAYPTGGFSHSLGFESSNKHKLVVTRGDFETFIIATLENAASQGLPFVYEAHKQFNNTAAIEEMDKRCHVCLSNHVANRASHRQGRAIIDTSSKAIVGQTRLVELAEEIRNDRIRGHFAVMFGALCGSLQLSVDSTATMFLFATLKTVVASSVRLGSFGPLEAQKIQHKMQALIPEIIQRTFDLTIDEVHIKFPLVDLIQNIHDTMFSKLFYS